MKLADLGVGNKCDDCEADTGCDDFEVERIVRSTRPMRGRFGIEFEKTSKVTSE